MFFSLTKLAGALASPITFLTFMLLFSVLVAFFLPSRWIGRLGRRLGVLVVLLLTLIAITPVGYYALTPLENMHAKTKLPHKVEGIVVITADENPQISEARGIPTTAHATQRYVYLKRLSKLYPHAKIVVAGNTRQFFPSKNTSTKQVIQPVLDTIGVPRWRVRYEEKSKNTHENAVFAARKVKPSKKERWLLVTSAFHMPRALLCFEKAGWNVTPAQSDYFTSGHSHFHFGLDMPKQIRLLSIAAHEYYGLLAYWLMGWIDRPW